MVATLRQVLTAIMSMAFKNSLPLRRILTRSAGCQALDWNFKLVCVQAASQQLLSHC